MKIHPEMKPKKFNNKGKQKTTATTQRDLGSNSGDEKMITTMGMKGKDIARTSYSSCPNDTQYEKTRIEIFHIRVISEHTKIDTIFDSGSQENLISEDLVKKLNLETIPHPRPYPLGWI